MLSRLFRRRQWHEERVRELESYLEIETQDNIARGMSADEARYAARRKLGNLTLLREEIADLLYGIRPNDPGSLLLAVFVLLFVGAAAAYLPARRASRIDPAVALREE